MAISEKIQGGKTYITFGYWDGSKQIRIYCGKKGLDSTKENIKKAKQEWYESKMARLQEQVNCNKTR